MNNRVVAIGVYTVFCRNEYLRLPIAEHFCSREIGIVHLIVYTT